MVKIEGFVTDIIVIIEKLKAVFSLKTENLAVKMYSLYRKPGSN